MNALKGWILEAVIIAAGIIVLGLCLKSGIDNYVNKDRKVTVKGLAEMEMPADKVTWPIVTKEMGNDLQMLYADIKLKNHTVVAFLKKNGISDAEISVEAPRVNDREANDYSGNQSEYRYNVTNVITVTSKQVNKVRAIKAKQGELLTQGVAIIDSYDEGGIRFEFTSFKDVKAKMMEEAINNARKTADQFAKMSGGKLNKIITADQGQFTIENRDENTPYIKSLRVVSTITYSLKN
jgi:hypothetical protein